MGLWDQINSLVQDLLLCLSIVRIAGAAGIIVISLVLRRIFVKYIVRLLRRITSKVKNPYVVQLVDVLEKPVRFIFIVVGVTLSFRILNFQGAINKFASNVTMTLIYYTVFWSAYRMVGASMLLLKKIVERTETIFDDMLISFLGNGAKVLVVVVGSITVAQVWFSEIAGILTGLGLGGLAFALAAKDTAANLFGSVTIMADRPFTIGDWIETPHVEGVVEEMGFRSTRVRTFAQALVTIPNATMSNDTITNWSRMGKRRITFRLGLAYDTFPEQIEEFVQRVRAILEKHEGVHPQTILVYFDRLSEDALEIFFYFFTKTTAWKDFLEIQQDINLRILEVLHDMQLCVAVHPKYIYFEKLGMVPVVREKQ